MTYLVAFIVITITVVTGYKLRLLTISGAIAAFFTGVLVYAGIGFNGLIILGLFFGSSSFWSKIKNAKKQRAEELLVKGSQRDWLQVAANGGLAALTGGIYYITNDPLWMLGFCITIASANSDTWASEIGSMSKSLPYYIRTFKRAERGTSGAISPLGTLASIAGSFLIAIAAFFLLKLPFNECLLITILGFIGNLIDTLLGAFIQAGYQCSQCGLKTEKTFHCGQNTILIKGFSCFNNDVVNAISGLFSLVFGILILTN